MQLLAVVHTTVSYPTGNKSFAVQQAFPGNALAPELTDPFLMCDFFGPTVSRGAERDDSDRFPVDWHPHRGMDVITYLIQGVGRHADSLGNRDTFHAPGMQWARCGSGIEHAEGGGTPKGETYAGFQIWINAPAHKKMDDPAYGIESTMPEFNTGSGSRVRVICGEVNGNVIGPLKPSHTAGVQILDVCIDANCTWEHALPKGFDTCLVFAYHGSGVGGIESNTVLVYDASRDNERMLRLQASNTQPLYVLMFAGRKLKQPIAWHGPFVMSTREEILLAISEYQQGTFLKQRAAWDYFKRAQL